MLCLCVVNRWAPPTFMGSHNSNDIRGMSKMAGGLMSSVGLGMCDGCIIIPWRHRRLTSSGCFIHLRIQHRAWKMLGGRCWGPGGRIRSWKRLVVNKREALQVGVMNERRVLISQFMYCTVGIFIKVSS